MRIAGRLLAACSAFVLGGGYLVFFFSVLLSGFFGFENWTYTLSLSLGSLAILLAPFMREAGKFLNCGEFEGGREVALKRAMNRFISLFGSGIVVLIFIMVAAGRYLAAAIALFVLLIFLWSISKITVLLLRKVFEEGPPAA